MRGWIALAVVMSLVWAGAAVSQPTSAAFSDGSRDRSLWEGWFAGLSGDAHDGALWWAAHRSLKVHGSCNDPGMTVTPAWLTGCQQAQARLTPDDLRRAGEPEYRLGWNSYGAAPAAAPAAASSPAITVSSAPPVDRALQDLTKRANANCDIVLPTGGVGSGYIGDTRLYAMQEQCLADKQRASVELTQRRADDERRAQQAQAEAARAAEQARIEAAKAAQIAAENSSENHCRDATMAGEIIDEINKMEEDRFPVIKVIDIDHLTTRSWNDDKTSISCHGVFLFSNGLRIAATYSTRTNVAGRIIMNFMPD